MLVTAVSLLAALLFCGLVLLILAVIAHNRLHSLLNRCGNAFRQLDRHLEQRAELIAQRVAACAPENGEQRARWESMARQCQAADAARQAAAERFGDAACMDDWVRAQQQCESALSTAPDADATRAAPQLAGDWSDAWRSTTGKIAFAREAFNDFARQYNAARNQFPARLFATRLRFSGLPLLLPPGEPQAR